MEERHDPPQRRDLPPPPSRPQRHREPSLAEQSVRRLVVGSRFFPREAADDGWFRPPLGGGDGDANPARDDGDSKPTQGDDGRAKPAPDQSSGAKTRVATLEEREVRVGKLLGTGGFCEVRAATLEGGNFNSNRPYAIKYLSPTIGERKGRNASARGAADLAVEARFLSLLRHDNIIGLHYVGAAGLCDRCHRPGANGQEDGRPRRLGYFLILDRLEETLDRRIKNTFIPEVESLTRDRLGNERIDARGPRRRWPGNLSRWRQSPQVASKQDNRRFRESLRSLLAKRLIVLRCVASAVKHLHDRRILFRDLKPDNVGFYRDPSGERGESPKLYDFGLARELKPSDGVASTSRSADGGAVYNLTGRTGSRRYMSPEVAFSRPYNCKADVYSFGIMLYELATLTQPFEGLDVHRHEIEVLRRGGRPGLPGRDDWPEDLAPLIEACWSGDLRDRPGINEVVERLDGCIDDLASTAAGEDHSSKLPGRETTSPLPPAGPGADGPGCKGGDKMRQLLSSLSVAGPAVLLQRRR